jgi:spermidine synthase
VAVIGLGSGDTAWAAACRPATRAVTVFELLAPQLRLLSRLEASPRTPPGLRTILADPRIEHRVADGRNALALEAARYDVIEMDALFPSSPYSGNLYSVEFFQLCARRLQPGGVMCSWSPRPRVAHSFRRAFPHVIEMRDASILIGSNDPLPLDVAAWVARSRAPEVAAYLGENNVRKLVACLETARPGGVEPAPESELNRDLFPRDEFKTADE